MIRLFRSVKSVLVQGRLFDASIYHDTEILGSQQEKDSER